MIASLGGLVCLPIRKVLMHEAGQRWHFSRFGIIVGEIVPDMQGFSRGGEEHNWRTFCDEGLWLHNFFTRWKPRRQRAVPPRLRYSRTMSCALQVRVESHKCISYMNLGLSLSESTSWSEIEHSTLCAPWTILYFTSPPRL